MDFDCSWGYGLNPRDIVHKKGLNPNDFQTFDSRKDLDGEDNYRLNLWFEKTDEMELSPNIFRKFD